MNSRQRMALAMRHEMPDRVPVMCQLALGHYFLNSQRPPHEIWFTSEGFAEALVERQRRFGFDGILINIPGRPENLLDDLKSVENTPDGEKLTWSNGQVTLIPWDDNPFHYLADGSDAPREDFDTIDPDQLDTQTELTEVAQKYPSEISGGMQKRAALARALVTDPQTVMFDEPTTGQDPIRKNAILGMIAEYKKKVGFTAVLISHEIPDVFFISNRILALWDKRIVFEGTPEEMEYFNHPFHDEILQSLENLQEDITGLYSSRHFKIRYQTELARRGGDESYAVLMFGFDNLDEVSESISHDAAQQTLRALGNYIRKHFGAVGGFSTRQSINEFATILPFSDLEEARRILERFTADFRDQGMRELVGTFQKEVPQDQCFDFVISVGMAPGPASGGNRVHNGVRAV